MIRFLAKLGAMALLLGIAAIAIGRQFDDIASGLGLGAVVLMALNALAAIFPLYMVKRRNPFNVYLQSMILRLAALGVVFWLVLSNVAQSSAEQYFFVLSTFASFVAFQAVEIQHLLSKDSPMKGQTPS